MEEIQTIVRQLHEIEAVCFGEFTLKNGIQSPVYIDLRLALDLPKVMDKIAELIWAHVAKIATKIDVICGVPSRANSLAMCLSLHSGIPMIYLTEDITNYGCRKLIQGRHVPGRQCLVLEDVLVNGESTMKTVEILRDSGYVVVVLDSQQGGKANIENEGLKVLSIVTVTKLLEILHLSWLVDGETRTNYLKFIDSTRLRILPGPKLTYKSRAVLCKHPANKRLFEIMAEKETNLAISADVTTCDNLLEIAQELGPYICMIKTRVNLLKDFSLEKLLKLTNLAEKHNFLIFEESKSSNIENKVKDQYESDIVEIAEWSYIINAHSLSRPDIIQGFTNIGQPTDRTFVLIAEASSSKNLCIKAYIQKMVELDLVNKNKDYVHVIGFVSQSCLTSDPKMLNMVPGVRLAEGNGCLGQSYITPEKAFSAGADLVFVDKEILKAADKVKRAEKYKKICFSEYLKHTVAVI
ncbi:orotidine-5'-phosphate decarboxylase [Chamberlinius hualienensis]